MWMFFQKPDVSIYEHGGFIFGLGILGMLDCLEQVDVYKFLS